MLYARYIYICLCEHCHLKYSWGSNRLLDWWLTWHVKFEVLLAVTSVSWDVTSCSRVGIYHLCPDSRGNSCLWKISKNLLFNNILKECATSIAKHGKVGGRLGHRANQQKWAEWQKNLSPYKWPTAYHHILHVSCHIHTFHGSYFHAQLQNILNWWQSSSYRTGFLPGWNNLTSLVCK